MSGSRPSSVRRAATTEGGDAVLTPLLDQLAEQVLALALDLDVDAGNYSWRMDDGTLLALGWDRDRPGEVVIIIGGKPVVWRLEERWP